MLRQLFCLSLLFLGSLSADTFFNTHIQFPQHEQWTQVDSENTNRIQVSLETLEKWKQDNPGNADYVTFFRDDSMVSSKEFFSILASPDLKLSDHLSDTATLWAEFRKADYNDDPTKKCNILAIDDHSSLLEIYTFEQDIVSSYALERTIHSINQTVYLQYYSPFPGADFEAAKEKWVPLLLKATGADDPLPAETLVEDQTVPFNDSPVE